MLTIARLFGKSPFSPMQTHMKKVSSCIKKLTQIFDALLKKSDTEIEELVKELSKLEHEADLTKNDIRNHLPKSLFLPIDRSQLLNILSIQDNIADKAEDIGHLLILHPLKSHSHLYQNLQNLFAKNVEAFWDARNIIKVMDELLESSFGGVEAEKVKTLIDRAAYVEYESDKLKHALLKEFFLKETELPTAVFYLYIRLVEEINEISHISEKLANQIRMILEAK